MDDPNKTPSQCGFFIKKDLVLTTTARPTFEKQEGHKDCWLCVLREVIKYRLSPKGDRSMTTMMNYKCML